MGMLVVRIQLSSQVSDKESLIKRHMLLREQTEPDS
jgi:hypothetical protein